MQPLKLAPLLNTIPLEIAVKSVHMSELHDFSDFNGGTRSRRFMLALAPACLLIIGTELLVKSHSYLAILECQVSPDPLHILNGIGSSQLGV
mgnify:CR=1 FL=1